MTGSPTAPTIPAPAPSPPDQRILQHQKAQPRPTRTQSPTHPPTSNPAHHLNPSVTGNPHITLMLCRHGGHCAFVGPRSDEDDGYWAENQIVSFFESSSRTAGG